MNKPVVKRSRDTNGLQRATESFRYGILSLEHWLSPKGHLREWTRRNFLLGAFLFIPAVFVMPAVVLPLWQVDGSMTLLTSMVTNHPVQTLVLLFVLKALLKR